MSRERGVPNVPRSKKVPVDKLDAAIKGILRDYGNEIAGSMNEAVKKVTREGVKTLKAESRQKFKTHSDQKPYYRGWTSRVETGKRSAQGVIYNKDVPGLPHLLEYGHANRGGGRTPGRVHIQPVNDKIVESFLKEVQQAI